MVRTTTKGARFNRRQAQRALTKQASLLQARRPELFTSLDDKGLQLLEFAKQGSHEILRLLEWAIWRAGAADSIRACQEQSASRWQLYRHVKDLALLLSALSTRTGRAWHPLMHGMTSFFNARKVDGRNNP